MKVGQSVYAIGTPFGEVNFNNFTWGGVSRIDSKAGIIQHTASVNAGNSGGPLLNSQAEVIGVNTSIEPPQVFEFVNGKPQASSVVVKGNVGISRALSLSRLRQFISSAKQKKIARVSPHLKDRSQSQANQLQFDGKEVSGVLNDSIVRDVDGSYVNYYIFEGKIGQPIVVDMLSQDVDSQLVLYKISKQADGSLTPDWSRVIAENDDVTPANLNSRLLATLPENGIYLLVAKSYGNVESGRYRLSAKITSPTLSAQAQANKKVRFFCAQGYDQDAKQYIPTTYAWNPQRQGKIALIRWKSQYFEQFGWNAQKRCGEISPKFQTAYQNGNLRYLTAGTWDKKAVICGVRKQGDNCGADYLFTIKPTDEPGLVAQQLMGLLTGDAGGVGVLTQSTGSVYIDLEQFLSTAPLEANR